MANMIVAGAGDSRYNGTYVETGTENGRPKYILSEYRILYWSGTQWLFGSTLEYFSNDDVATPDLCTTWLKSKYMPAPVPTVTASGGGDPPSSIINHVMHYRRLMSR